MLALAYAKINLMLDILDRTEDGYHTCFNVMQSVSLADRVTLLPTGKPGTIELHCTDPSVPVGEDNLAYRAAARFFSESGCQNPGIRILIEKKIPVAAGLAGGSADAAAVFKLLNKFLQTDFSEKELCEMALDIGVDVPFCIQGGTMLGLDLGEILAPLPHQEDCFYVICNPDRKVSTKEAYAAFDRVDTVRHLDQGGMLRALVTGEEGKLFRAMGNVLEQAVEVPERVEIKSLLRQYGAKAHLMSGSGPTTYGVFKEKTAAEACCRALKHAGFSRTFLCCPKPVGVEITAG